MAHSCEFEFTPVEGKISYNQLDSRDPFIPKQQIQVESSTHLHYTWQLKPISPMVHYVVLPPCSLIRRATFGDRTTYFSILAWRALGAALGFAVVEVVAGLLQAAADVGHAGLGGGVERELGNDWEARSGRQSKKAFHFHLIFLQELHTKMIL